MANGSPACTPASEFPRRVAVEEITDEVQRLEVVAESDERAELARRFGLVALDALRAEVSLRRTLTGEIVLNGRLEADVAQRCVVSLDPFNQTVCESFTLRLKPGGGEPEGDLAIAAGDEEPAEPVDSDAVDVGEFVAQQLSLALDPFPRVPDAELPGAPRASHEKNEEAGDTSPFAVLADLKQRLERGR